MNGQIATGIVFLAYMMGVFALTVFSHRILAKRSFLAEYFLGSRRLGSWALAFTFAATSASGGSFTGYPSFVYTYGWILALWIGSYMVVPIVSMGLLGKRLNQVGRRAGAITVPDVLRERFASTGLALFATFTIVFFTTTNLIAQFKAGGVILNALLEDTPGYVEQIVPRFAWINELPFLAETPTGYIVGLLIFALTVVAYTAYGGFRAVVWTDVLQGVVMGIGVLLLIPFVFVKAGGLERVTRALHDRPARLVLGLQSDHNALEYRAREGRRDDLFVEHKFDAGHSGPPVVRLRQNEQGDSIIEVLLANKATARAVKEAVDASLAVSPLVEVELPGEPDDALGTGPAPATAGPSYLRPGRDLIYGPGRLDDGSPFHPLAMGFSFFFMWAIAGAGQPGTMVRLMAFQETKTLRRAMVIVTLYYGMIYLPIVFLFVSAQILVHPSELTAGPDQIMPALAKRVAPPMLAGLMIAAPFAAVMSTVDSFLLLISSGLVRDIYQRTIDPNISERAVKRASYATTAVIGTLVTILALRPPDFLQYLIVFTGAGFAATFLPTFCLGLYWKRTTRAGAWAGMVSGFVIVVGLFSAGHIVHFFQPAVPAARIDPLGLHPIVIGLAGSTVLGIVVSLLTRPMPDSLVRYYFAPSQKVGHAGHRPTQ